MRSLFEFRTIRCRCVLPNPEAPFMDHSRTLRQARSGAAATSALPKLPTVAMLARVSRIRPEPIENDRNSKTTTP